MDSIAKKLESLSILFQEKLDQFISSHPGDEEILASRFLRSISPKYVDIMLLLRSLEEEVGMDDFEFLLRQFSVSLGSIEEMDEEFQKSFFFNAFDGFLGDMLTVLEKVITSIREEKIQVKIRTSQLESTIQRIFEFDEKKSPTRQEIQSLRT